MSFDLEAHQRLMREQELQRRATRLAVFKNHAETNKDLSDDERVAVGDMLATVDAELKAPMKDRRGYWKYLWDAVRNIR
jgi:hypothetical protein